MNTTTHLQSVESRHRIINQFCKLIAASAIASAILYVYLKMHVLTAATLLVAGLFLFFVYLNKKGRFKISRAAIVTTTNLGIIFFSFYLGFESGIYFYLFVAPLLIYLLFDFSEKRSILFFLLMYISTFIFIHTDQNPFPGFSANAEPEHIKFIYSFNFCVTLILCFGLVTYFAGNNKTYILSLTDHQEKLTKEIDLRIKNEEIIKKSLREREVLMAEIHHRVKNNLAIISAMINMQMNNLTEDKSRRVFEETKNRIFTMALIHNLLYQNKSFAHIDLAQYINTFCTNLHKSYLAHSKVEIEQKIERVVIDINTAIPLALILNELMTNSIKHAFTDTPDGKISVVLERKDENHYTFTISNTGSGMDEKIIKECNKGMGLNIVQSLVEQIDGVLCYSNVGGSHFTITFPLIATDPKALLKEVSQN